MMNYLDRLTALNQVEAFRMGLWQLMMVRGQGHFAHKILCSGFAVQFYIERVKEWGKWTHPEVIMVECCVSEFVADARDCAATMEQKGQVNKYTARIDRMYVELSALGKTDEQMGMTERKRKEKATSDKPANLYNERNTDPPTSPVNASDK